MQPIKGYASISKIKVNWKGQALKRKPSRDGISCLILEADSFYKSYCSQKGPTVFCFIAVRSDPLVPVTLRYSSLTYFQRKTHTTTAISTQKKQHFSLQNHLEDNASDIPERMKL